MRKLTLSLALMVSTSLTAPVFADGHLPIVEEPLDLSIHLHFKRATEYDENWPVEQAAREMTNIHLKNATVGSNTDNSEEAFNLLLASGNMPDIVGTSRIKEYVNQYGPEGAFQPLNDLIDAHAPNLKAFLDERPELRAAITSADGNIYYVPYFPDGKYGRAYFIRQDWLDKLGLETPETVDEVKTVLEAFRDGDPNGNGLKDEVPYFARQWEEAVRLVTLFDGRTSGSDTYHDFMVNDGKLEHPYATEGYRDGIKNLAEWYAEGLIDSEVFTRGSSARDFLLSENLGGMTHDWFASTSGYNRLSSEIEGFSLKAFAPPASPSGRRLAEHRRIPVKPDGWAMGFSNEHPVETNEIALEGIALYDEGDYLIDQFLGVSMNADEQRTFDKSWASIRTYMLERQQAWILGSGNVEADWADYMSTLEGMGLNDVLAVMQSAYDRQYGG